MNTTKTPKSEAVGTMWASPLVYVDDFPEGPNLKGILGALVTYDHKLRTDKTTIRAVMVTEEDGVKFCIAVNSHARLLADRARLREALRDILAAYHGLTLGCQDTSWEGQFKVKARAALKETES